MILSAFSKERRQARRELLTAHREALAEAQVAYDELSGHAVVLSEGAGPGYSFISAATPDREAWEIYFDAMRDRGFSAWNTDKLFRRQLKTRR